jgi:hypothetical protein
MIIVFGNRHSFLFHTSRQSVFLKLPRQSSCSRPQNKSFGSNSRDQGPLPDTKVKHSRQRSNLKSTSNQERSIYIVSATPQRVQRRLLQHQQLDKLQLQDSLTKVDLRRKTSDATFGPNGQYNVGRAECFLFCFGVVSAN